MNAIEHPEWNAWLDEVRVAGRDRLPEIVRPYIPKGGLVNAGRGQLHGFSPLRESSGASFYVYPEGMWHDFGLGESGDAIGFLRRRHSLGFREAVDMLARECSLPTWEERKRARGMAIADPATLMDLWAKNEAAQRVFETMTAIVHLCWAALPSQVRAHLRDHYRLSEDTIDLEKIGWVPAGLWELCREHLPYDEEALLASGFFVRTEHGPEAALAGRMLFPYFKDGLARYTIGREFFGRARKEDATIPEWDRGKYKKHLTHSAKFPYVSPHISNEILWGEDTVTLTPSAERRTTWILMSEGITDALMLKQLGFPVLSPVTVTVSSKQAVRMALVCHGFAGLMLCNDNDVARDGSHPGDKGAKRTASIVWREGRQAKIATLPKPIGVAKIDVNELVGGWLAGGDTIEEAKARYEREVLSKALSLGEFIVAEWPAEMDAATVERELVSLGELAARLTVMQQHDLMARAVKRWPRLPKAPMRQAFLRGVREESERRSRELVAEEVGAPREPTDPSKRAALRSVIIDELGSYERLNGDNRERVSSFSLIPTRLIVSEERGVPNRLECDVVGLDGSTVYSGWIIPSNAWNSKKQFVASMPSERMHWFGGDDEVQAILELQTGRGVAHLPRLCATKTVGYHEVDGSPRFVLPSGTLDAAGWMANPDIVFVSDGGSTLEHRLPKTRPALDETTTVAAREIAQALPELHEARAIVPMLAWFAALPFKPWLIEKLGGFPFLDVSASPGAGKTSLLAWVLWPMFCGALPGELMSATQTHFAMLKDFSAANALAVIFDEFKTTDIPKPILDDRRRLARRVWSGDVETRGRADQTVSHYALTAGVCFAGETGFDDDPATAERGLHVSLDPRWLAGEPGARARELFGRVRAMPLSGVGVLFQRWSLSADKQALLARAEAEADEFLARADRALGLPPRIRVVLVTVALGIGAFEAWAASLGLRIELRREGALFAALAGTLGIGPGGELGGSLLSALDAFVVDASRMATLGLIAEGTHYAWVRGELFLNLAGCEAARESWYRTRGACSTSPGVKALKKIAGEAMGAEGARSYVVNTAARVAMDEDRRPHGLLLAPARFPARLEADEFPMKTNRTWGGARAPRSGERGAWGEADWRARGRGGRDDDEGPGGGRSGAN